MTDSIARPELEVAILGMFGVLALVLACVGIYAVISYSVEQRTRDASVSAILAISGIAGCYFPARRATNVDPAIVLREE